MALISLRRTVALVGVLLGLSCGDEGMLGVLANLPEPSTPQGIRYEVRDSLFGSRDTIRVALTNSTDRSLGYNLCSDDLELWDGTEWVRVNRRTENTFCAGVLNILLPGDSSQSAQPVYGFIRSGDYRFRGEIEWIGDGARVEVVSNGFRIRK